MRWLYAVPDGAWAPVVAIGGGREIPAPPLPAPMPDLEDPALLAERRKALRGARQRSGRLSTIFTDENQDDNSYRGDRLGLA